MSDIQGVNVVINKTLKVQEKMIENLREDLGTQEDMEVVEISIENNPILDTRISFVHPDFSVTLRVPPPGF